MRALVTGINGQDGRYLAELLTAKGYDVVGTVQPGNAAGAAVVGRECPDAVVLEADLADGATLLAAVEEAQPDEVYNLAAFSSVSASWQQAEHASDITATGVVRLLEALRTAGGGSFDGVRFFQGLELGDLRQGSARPRRPRRRRCTPAPPTASRRRSRTT